MICFTRVLLTGWPSRAFMETSLANFSTGINKNLTRAKDMKLPADPESRQANTETEVLNTETLTDRKKLLWMRCRCYFSLLSAYWACAKKMSRSPTVQTLSSVYYSRLFLSRKVGRPQLHQFWLVFILATWEHASCSLCPHIKPGTRGFGFVHGGGATDFSF